MTLTIFEVTVAKLLHQVPLFKWAYDFTYVHILKLLL